MATKPAPAAAATGHNDPETSFTMLAPASIAASATPALRVSTDTRTRGASAAITSTTRLFSSASSTGAAPGRVLSPPTSTTAAPSAIMASP
jgi:hypothetical protein